MRILYGIESIDKLEQGSVCTIGSFETIESNKGYCRFK